MPSKITNRIVAQAGISRLLPALAEELPPADLQSLLLSVFQQRGRSVHESGIMVRARENPLFVPSDIDSRRFMEFDRIAFALADEFDALDLSPVCPFGTASLLGSIDQNNVLTALRSAELLGDSTLAMALHCARRRKTPADRRSSDVRLCSSHRLVRLQPFDTPGFSPHFRLFGLVSAGRDRGSHGFEIRHLSEHIRFYLQLFRALNEEGYVLGSPLVELSDLSVTEALLSAAGAPREEIRQSIRAHRPGVSERFLREHNIVLPADVADPARELQALAQEYRLETQLARLALLKERICEPLQADYPEARFCFNLARLEGIGYYPGLCLRISPSTSDGERYGVVDGGFTRWTARLLQDRKERLLTSGIGTEFVCRRYRA